MARNKNVRATLKEGLRENDALKPTYLQRIKVFDKHIQNVYEQTSMAHASDPKKEIIDLRRMSKEQIAEYIPTYIAERRALGLSESTLHTDLAALCRAIGKSMSDYETIHRGQPTKGRNAESLRIRSDENKRVVDFAKAVGIRKNEYAQLRGSDFLIKDNRAYVVVRHGKGGKYQEQLIADKDIEFVKSYFAGKKSDEYIFTLEEIKACQHANLHEIRREHAQEMYEYYNELLKNPAEREKMKDLLEKRFNENPRKKDKFDRELMDKEYVCRGAVRREIEELGKDYKLDRLAAMAVSNLFLAHYRVEVFCKNYYK